MPLSSASPAAPPAQADADPRAAPVFVQRICRKSAWPKMLHSQHGGANSVLRLSQTWGCEHWDMRASCARCGATLTQGCRDVRPLGALWSWLDYQCTSGEQHRTHRPSFAERHAARLRFEGLPGSTQWCTAEHGGAGFGEPSVSPIR